MTDNTRSDRMTQPCAGVILCGGQSRSFGSNKALAPYHGSTILSHLIAKLTPQVAALSLSVRDQQTIYEPFGLPLLADDPNGQGPLAGIVQGMDWAKQQGYEWLATFPVDSPELPHDLVQQWQAIRGKADVVITRGAGRTQWVMGLWSVGLQRQLANQLATGIYALKSVLMDVSVAYLEVADPIANINTPEDLAALGR